ncbi:EamA family transporter RarD [Calidifontibacillus oryziterrae]|uniref:EamA family transporter RarD n=1 Tax=Calidifontibacillus oryziterrae TaxID=1191699 RepID=UPI00030CB46E|nr:EamA family transporter RarD [Calidifontibacillus oryziterrae]
MDQLKNQQAVGIWNGVFAYLIWGVLPLYWIAVGEVSAPQILAHRIVWSFIFMIVIILVLKKWHLVITDIKSIITNPAAFFSLFFSGVLISANWFIYIWAVNAGHVIETSLGYYINPLISVLLGIIVLKEQFDFWQKISFLLAAGGVLILTVEYGSIPWVSLGLALSFGIYGLVKKKANLSSITGLTFETMMVTPIALFYLLYVHSQGTGHFGVSSSLSINLLLIGSGIVTAIPLLLFAEGAKRITLSLIGFLQYISPTINLIIGVFILREHFSHTHLIAFSFIWVALAVYSVSRSIVARRARRTKTVA